MTDEKHMTRLKICGITNLEDARYCAAAGADYLGFIQYDQSPRYVEPRLAGEIIEWVYGPEAVGVFVNAAADEVNRTADEAGFSLVQLHGAEPPELCADIDRPVIKALRIGPDMTGEQLRRQMDAYAEHVDFFLLDTHRAGLWGGTGETFDWNIVRDLTVDFRVFLAGGIGRDNVEDALGRVNPYAIDLSSSVEEAPGKKDFDRLADFFDRFDRLRSSAQEM